MRIAFLGVGFIGEPMAEHLLAKGHAVTVVGHRNRAPVERLVARGATEAASPAQAARVTDAAFLVLPTSKEVEAVMFDGGGIVSAMPSGYLVLDLGTCYPADTRKLAARFQAEGGRFLDAPITGGVQGARDAALTVMVGGEEPLLEQVRPALQAFAKEIYHFGPIGAGHTAKLIQNMIGWIEVAGIAEGLALAKATGLDLDKFFGMLSASHSNSPLVQWMVPKVYAGAFDEVDFRLELAHKDIRQAAALARDETVLPLPVVNAATELYQLARAAGFGRQDWTAVIRGLESVLGAEVRTDAAATRPRSQS